MWRRLTRRTLAEFVDDRCTHVAAAIAYYALLSVFPLLIVLVSAVSLLMQRSESASRVAAAVASTFPVAGQSISHALEHVSAVSAGSVGAAGAVGLLWTASGVFGAMRDGINRAYDVQSSRPFLQRKLVDVAMATATAVLLLASTAAVSALHVLREVAAGIPAIGRALASAGILWSAGSALVGLALAALIVTVLYWLVPASRLRLRDIWPGVVVGTVLLQATQYGFAFYVGSVSHYNVVYGSLGTIVAFMVWVYLASLAILVGAEVASEYPRIRESAPSVAHDSATPVPRRVRRFLLSLVSRQ